MRHRRPTLLAIGIVLVIAGCGSGSSGAATPGPATPTAAAARESTPMSSGAAASPTAAPATHAAASEAAASAPAHAAGGGLCDLVTAAELAKAFGRDDVTATLTPGPPDTCGYTSSDGTSLGAIVLLTAGGKTVFDGIHQGDAITDLPGIGDKAFYSSEMQTLVVLKGDAMLTVAVVAAATDDARLAAAKAIATAASGRM
ncbi:MAG: hypothetical protein U0838_11615 [Chloroflexota bacterium]